MAIELLNPQGIYEIERHQIAPRLKSLEGITLGLIDSSKDNADIFLDELEELLSEKFKIKEVLRIRKPISSVPAKLTDEFVESCDCVINAFGD